MARIEGIRDAEAGLFVRLAYWLTRRRLGRVVELVRVMAHQPWLLRAVGGFEFSFERARQLDPKLKHLAQIKVATLVGCPF